LVTVNDTVVASPTSTVAGAAVTVAVSADGSCTVMGEARLALADRAEPVFLSAPAVEALKVRDPAVEGVQVQENATGDPGTAVCGGDGAAAEQMLAGEGVTELKSAEAPPLSVTVNRTVRDWPTLAVVGLPSTEMAAESAAAVCTVTAAGLAGEAVTVWLETASVPLAVPLSVMVPALAPVQVQV